VLGARASTWGSREAATIAEVAAFFTRRDIYIFPSRLSISSLLILLHPLLLLLLQYQRQHRTFTNDMAPVPLQRLCYRIEPLLNCGGQNLKNNPRWVISTLATGEFLIFLLLFPTHSTTLMKFCVAPILMSLTRSYMVINLSYPNGPTERSSLSPVYSFFDTFLEDKR
jgi:hypothetical protein